MVSEDRVEIRGSCQAKPNPGETQPPWATLLAQACSHTFQLGAQGRISTVPSPHLPWHSAAAGGWRTAHLPPTFPPPPHMRVHHTHAHRYIPHVCASCASHTHTHTRVPIRTPHVCTTHVCAHMGELHTPTDASHTCTHSPPCKPSCSLPSAATQPTPSRPSLESPANLSQLGPPCPAKAVTMPGICWGPQ